MSVIRLCTVACDVCDTECEASGYDDAEARRFAADAGFRRRRFNGRYIDRCADCERLRDFPGPIEHN